MDKLLNTIQCMDAVEFLQSLPDDSVDMMLTDIPYDEINSNRRLWKRREGKNGAIREIYKFAADDLTFDIEHFANECLRVCSKWIYIFCGTRQLGIFRTIFSDYGCMTRVGIWHKTNPTPLHAQYIWLSSTETCVVARKPQAPFYNFYADSVWSFPAGKSKIHPTQKPIELFDYLINASTKPGEVICDPCIGSGTMALAARKNGRHYIGCDLNQDYVELARARLAKPFTPNMFIDEPEDEKPQQKEMEL